MVNPVMVNPVITTPGVVGPAPAVGPAVAAVVPAVVAVVAAVAGVAAAASGVRSWVTAQRVAHRLEPDAPTSRAASSAPPAVGRLLAAAGVEGDPGTLLRLHLAGVSISLVLAAIAPSFLVIAVVAAAAPPAALFALRHRAARRRTRQLPLALEAVAPALRGGHALAPAIMSAATIGHPLGPELRAVASRAAAGEPLVASLSHWAGTATDGPSRLAAAALVVAADVGGPGAEALDAAAASVREVTAVADEADALSVQARMSAGLLTVAPVAFTFLLTTTDRAAADFLFGSPLGWLCVGGGVGLDALGAWWMSRMIGRSR